MRRLFSPIAPERDAVSGKELTALSEKIWDDYEKNLLERFPCAGDDKVSRTKSLIGAHNTAEARHRSFMSIHPCPHSQGDLIETYGILKHGGALPLNAIGFIAPIRAIANRLFPRLPCGDAKMYSPQDIEDVVRPAGFGNIRYRKVSPCSFRCVAEEQPLSALRGPLSVKAS